MNPRTPRSIPRVLSRRSKGLSALLAGLAWVTALPTLSAEPALKGRFESGCQPMVKDSLHYIDIIELTPKGPHRTDAQYRKRFFAAPGCAADQKLVTLKLPVSHWTHDGTALVQGRPVLKVIAESVTSPMTATIHQPAKVREEPDAFVITYGPKNATVPIEKMSEGGRVLELRWLQGDQLFVSNMDAPSPDQYPTEVDLDNPFTRVRPGKAR